jgi:TalC/MipB family fructose-6-phosphate aldolase
LVNTYLLEVLMEIWLDTIDLKVIEEAAGMGLIAGVTTNPKILAKAPQMKGLLQGLLDAQEGPVCVQVTATEVKGMVQQAQRLFDFSDRLIIKVPVNRWGLAAMGQLEEKDIPFLGTAVLEPRQALAAAHAGALFVAPYISQMPGDAFATVQRMMDMTRPFPTLVMGAYLQSMEQLLRCAELGLPAVTLPANLFAALVEDHPASETFTADFHATWKAAFPGRSADQLIET